MKTLVAKMSRLGLLKFRFIAGTIIMAVAFIGLPVSILAIDASLMAEPSFLVVIGSGMLFFGLVGFLGFVNPYLVYRKLPAVQAETDGEFLYIHTKKEVKIPLASLEEATANVDLPYIFQEEFILEFIVHLFSDKYGTVILEIPGYGEFKMPYVANAQEVMNELISFINEEINKN